MRPRDWPQPPQRPHAETLDTTTPSSASPSTLFHPLGKIGSQPEPFGHPKRESSETSVSQSSTTLKREDNQPLTSIAAGSKHFRARYRSREPIEAFVNMPEMVGSNYRRIAAALRFAEFVLLRALIKFRRANNGTGNSAA